jgi:hypothetical protein
VTTTSVAPGKQCTVRVWFGAHVIAEHTAPPAQAAQYEQAMCRRFAGLRVTNEPAGTQPVAPTSGTADR